MDWWSKVMFSELAKIYSAEKKKQKNMLLQFSHTIKTSKYLENVQFFRMKTPLK
jgi:hypothetical protein